MVVVSRNTMGVAQLGKTRPVRFPVHTFITMVVT